MLWVCNLTALDITVSAAVVCAGLEITLLIVHQDYECD